MPALQLQDSLREIGDFKVALDQHAIVAVTDPAGRIIDVNDKFCAISGYTRAELLGQDHRLINSGEHPKEFIRELWTTIGRGKVWRGEIKNRAKNGSFYWVDTTIVPLPGEDGKPRLFVAIRVDITARKCAEGALRQDEELFAKAFRLSPDCVMIVRLSDRTVVGANDAMCRLWGISPEEVVGKPVQDYVKWTNPDEQDAFRQTLAERGECLNFETVFRMADDRLLNFSLSSRRVTFGGEPCVLGVMQDITASKQAQETIRRLNAELEQRVAERTAQLEAANRELEAFSYSVSHDLRAPLRAVDGFSQAVLEDYGPQMPADCQRQLQIIQRAAQNMGQLIDGLLRFSQLGRQTLAMRRVEMGPLVRAVLAELSTASPGRRIEVRVGDLPAGEGDPMLLKQVWTNLIANALKFSGKREHAIVEVGSMQQEGRCIYFVRDNGSGFDMRYVDKLFGVFQRLHRTEDYEGTGVGLAIVQRIVQRHGGRVWAEGAVDRGATFFFTLGTPGPA